MTEPSASELLFPVREIVLKSGEIIRENNRKPRQIRNKGRIDLVTDTDLAVEEFLKQNIKKLYPEADFLAEEGTPEQKPGAATWVIDPVDGTTNFAHGLPFVATSLALWRRGRVELGFVNMPLLDECFWATAGGGAFLNGSPIITSRQEDPEKSLVATGFPYNITEMLPSVVSKLAVALKHSQGVRRCGAAAADMAYTACGRFDLFYEEGLEPWDVAAGWLLIEEAGGVVTRLNGSPFSLDRGDILAGNIVLHGKFADIFGQS